MAAVSMYRIGNDAKINVSNPQNMPRHLSIKKQPLQYVEFIEQEYVCSNRNTAESIIGSEARIKGWAGYGEIFLGMLTILHLSP